MSIQLSYNIKSGASAARRRSRYEKMDRFGGRTGFFLGGCASLGLKTSCDGRALARPSFFARGQTLAAFKIALFARGNELDGILQIKKTAEIRMTPRCLPRRADIN